MAGEALGSPLAQAGGIDQVHQAPVLCSPGGWVQLDSREGLQLALKARQHLSVRLPLHRVPAWGRRPELHSWVFRRPDCKRGPRVQGDEDQVAHCWVKLKNWLWM